MRRKTAPRHQRPATQWSNEELADELERISGLRPPPRGVPEWRLRFAEYEVASSVLLQARFTDDPELAKLEAMEGLLTGHAMPLSELAPHMERILGRELHADELSSGTLRR